ncbi:MAG: Gfo/Idh/MocA family oxidoreductase [Candidatus Heimdallarchaeota archaeon]|nr:Gfo/Idh/MocA family oxidoreductase [Candidatus Heimdallarchaeota archaeon]
MSETNGSTVKYKVGVIGTGFGSLVHVPAFQRHHAFEVVMIAGLDAEKTNKIASSLGIPWTVNWRELLDNEEISIISIAVPPKYQEEIAIEVLKSGKHVLCEKPLSVAIESALEMKKEAELSGLISMCNFEFRFLPNRAYFVDLIKNGYIGDLYSIDIKINTSSRINPREQGYNWWSEKSEGGGMLMGLGVHYIDFLLQIFGSVNSVMARRFIHIPKRLNKQTDRMRKVTADDSFYALLDVGTVKCSLNMSSVTPFVESSYIEASGSKGSILLKDDVLYSALIGIDQELKKMEIPTNYLLVRDRDDHVLVSPMMRVLDELSLSIKSGINSSPNFNDAYEVQKVIDAINQSHAKKKSISIE